MHLTFYKVYTACSVFLYVVRIGILAYCVMSWFRPTFRLYEWLQRAIEPFVRPFRGLGEWVMRKTGLPIDFSCWFAIIGISVVERLLWLLYKLLSLIK